MPNQWSGLDMYLFWNINAMNFIMIDMGLKKNSGAVVNHSIKLLFQIT